MDVRDDHNEEPCLLRHNEGRLLSVDAEVRGIRRGGTIGTRVVRGVYFGVGSSAWPSP